jgi:hypothetical protein
MTTYLIVFDLLLSEYVSGGSINVDMSTKLAIFFKGISSFGNRTIRSNTYYSSLRQGKLRLQNRLHTIDRQAIISTKRNNTNLRECLTIGFVLLL